MPPKKSKKSSGSTEIGNGEFMNDMAMVGRGADGTRFTIGCCACEGFIMSVLSEHSGRALNAAQVHWEDTHKDDVNRSKY